MIAEIKAIWGIIQAIRRFRAEVEAHGKDRLSPQAATRDRRRLELLVLDIIDKQDVGWRKLTKLDDELAEYASILLKSNNLALVLHGTDFERTMGRNAIITGSMSPEEQAEAIAKAAGVWQGPAGDRAQP
jgi:hypothetical protein